MSGFLRRLTRSEDAATTVEYILMAMLIAVVLVGVVTTMGTELKGVFTSAPGLFSGS